MIQSFAMSARIAAPLLALLIVLSAPALAADPPPSVTARLEYDVPAQGCPPASVLRDEFARRLGYDFVVEDAPLRVVVKIAREKGALASSLGLYDSAGKQLWNKPAVFPAWQCLTLVQAMAGLLAVRFDPLVFRAPAVEAPPPPPPPPPKREPEPEPAPYLRRGGLSHADSSALAVVPPSGAALPASSRAKSTRCASIAPERKRFPTMWP
ncbi:MAG: hypothetical protein ABI134_02990 [Byssovorax sp.]